MTVVLYSYSTASPYVKLLSDIAVLCSLRLTVRSPGAPHWLVGCLMHQIHFPKAWVHALYERTVSDF